MHGGEPNPYMVGSPHTWWPGQPAGQLWWGARLDGGQGGAPPAGQATTYVGCPMYGFPTMYLASPPGILIKSIRYQDFRYQVSEKRRKTQKN